MQQSMLQADTTNTALRLRCLVPSLPGAPFRSASLTTPTLATFPDEAASFVTLGEALAAVLDHAAGGQVSQ